MRLARSDRPCRLHARCMSRCLASDPHATDATSGHEWEDLRKSLAVLTAQCRHAIYIAIRVSPQMQMRNFAKLWPGGGGGKSRCRYYHGSRQLARYWFAIGFLLSTLPVLDILFFLPTPSYIFSTRLSTLRCERCKSVSSCQCFAASACPAPALRSRPSSHQRLGGLTFSSCPRADLKSFLQPQTKCSWRSMPLV